MGARGPIGKTTEQKQLEGTHRPSRDRRSARPEPISPLAKPPRCPAWLSVEAKRVWRETVPPLVKQGRVCTLDEAICAMYCAVAADLRQAEREIDELRCGGGLMVTSYRGGEKPHPIVGIATRLRREMLALAKELGLTPASRARLPEPPRTERPDAFDELLNRRRSSLDELLS